jgi:hypothetical protein
MGSDGQIGLRPDRFPIQARFFSSPQRPDLSGTHPASYPVGTGGSFPGFKAVGA